MKVYLFIYRRKKIGVRATEKWPNMPLFNTPEKKVELQAFAKIIEAECGIPEINFDSEGIAKHIQSYFTEQRRYRENKGKKKRCSVVS